MSESFKTMTKKELIQAAIEYHNRWKGELTRANEASDELSRIQWKYSRLSKKAAFYRDALKKAVELIDE